VLALKPSVRANNDPTYSSDDLLDAANWAHVRPVPYDINGSLPYEAMMIVHGLSLQTPLGCG